MSVFYQRNQEKERSANRHLAIAHHRQPMVYTCASVAVGDRRVRGKV
ncbi:hypothetical protein [Aerosakkonema funiforme]|uniref:Uncharacterized protein n=1 Tax=Aerosakkonema funiforme FACHB-1375 TaxID=2949571 RepID=A0A926VKB5_9CYAN|nr:hypothetical protein [Aerosakkonema funiforme]MBD2184833.1 hypothetical protein [Aerosakkonema funiforme FACHB-1375]